MGREERQTAVDARDEVARRRDLNQATAPGFTSGS